MAQNHDQVRRRSEASALKKPRQILKTLVGGSASESDYRALLALVLVAGLLALLAKGDHQAAGIIGPLAGSAVGWYFGGKRHGR